MKYLLLAMSFLTSAAFAGEKDLFVFKKSYNPLNVLHYAVNLDENCNLKTFSNGSYVKAYWVMGESDGHIEGLTNRELKAYAPTMTFINTQKDEMDFKVAAINELEDYIPNPIIKVQTDKKADQTCEAKATMVIDSKDITLKEVYTNGKFTITFNWKTYYMTITGINPDGSKFFKKLEQ
jgi:hypothetical protein